MAKRRKKISAQESLLRIERVRSCGANNRIEGISSDLDLTRSSQLT